MPPRFNVVLVAQAGRIGYEALLCAASLRRFHAAADLPIVVGTPRNGPLWKADPTITDAVLRAAFEWYGCTVLEFANDDFGSLAPAMNKACAIAQLPRDEAFLFLDSDVIATEPIDPAAYDFARPVLREATLPWPVVGPDTPSAGEIWRSLYRAFGLDHEASCDQSVGDDHPQRYPYYNAAMFYHATAGRFADTMLAMARRVQHDPPIELTGQERSPWLDQIVLPLAYSGLGVPRRREQRTDLKRLCHYQFPCFLLVQYDHAVKSFAEMCRDEFLVSVLERDPGYQFYLSDAGRRLVMETHAEFKAGGAVGGIPGFKTLLAARVPLMR